MSEKNKIEDLLLDDSFVRYAKGKAAGSELEYWNDWMKKDPHHPILFKQAAALITMTARHEMVIPDPQVELKHFQRVLKHGFRNQAYQNDTRGNHSRKDRNYWGFMVAAIVLIAISTGIFLNFGESNKPLIDQEVLQVVSNSEHQTTFGEKAYLHLPDGSRIVLNANSYLTYLKTGVGAEADTKVEVFLDGEALFDITPSENEAVKRNFQVQTPHGNVDVTGTVFWVESTDDFTRTVLEEGEVRLSKSSGSDVEAATQLVLKPGEMAQFSQGHDLIEVKNVNTKIYTSWITNVWTFDQTPVEDIALRIEKVFGVKVKILTPDLMSKTLSGTISSDNLQIIKEGLARVLEVEVTEADGTIFIGAT